MSDLALALPEDDLSSTAAHDLRTALAAISGFAELLLHRDDEATRRQAADQILAATARLEGGIDHVLTLLAIAEDDLALVPVPLSLSDAVAEVFENHADVVVHRATDPVVRADPDHVRQALAALASLVEGLQNAGALGSVEVVVGRTGAFGVVSLELDERTGRFAHERLEMHVARRLAELQGGSLITTRAREGVLGLRVELAVPLADRSRAAARRVLIADDDTTVRSLLRMTLPSAEYEIVEASDGAEALELSAAAEPNLVLLDWRMPGQSGAEVLRALKDERQERPVIVVTAATDEEARATARALGADRFLSKPFSPLELLVAVERLLGGGPNRTSA